MLTSKQRAFLTKLAANQKAIFQIGKGGVNENMLTQLENALEARELIKITVLETCEYSPREAAEGAAAALEADVVQVIGRKFILYRKSTKKPLIELP